MFRSLLLSGAALMALAAPALAQESTEEVTVTAQKLAEALVGYDLLGFHPDSTWQAGPSVGVLPLAYAGPTSLEQRKSRYIDLDTADVFRLGVSPAGDGLFFNTSGTRGGTPLAPDTYVLCDVFSVGERKITLGSGKTVSPGTPILYYRANPASKTFPDYDQAGADPKRRCVYSEPTDRYIYDVRDNWPLLSLGRLRNSGKPVVNPSTNVHPLEDFVSFYTYIWDARVPLRPSASGTSLPMAWPHRPDSYLLISAGADGLYGTDDDIRNFGQ